MHSQDHRKDEAKMFLDTDVNIITSVDNKKCDLHLSFCGHAMHFNCFDAYFDSVMQKSELQMGMMMDTDKGQFDCPLCKRLSNFLVPVPDMSHLSFNGFRKRIKTERKVLDPDSYQEYQAPDIVMTVASDLDINDLDIRNMNNLGSGPNLNESRGPDTDFSHTGLGMIDPNLVGPF
jgi:hypothetical protein